MDWLNQEKNKNPAQAGVYGELGQLLHNKYGRSPMRIGLENRLRFLNLY